MVCIIHGTLSLKACQEPVLPTPKGWVNSWETAFFSQIVEVVLHDIFQPMYVGVSQFGQIIPDIVLKVHFHHRTLAFIGVSSSCSVVPVPAIELTIAS